MNKIKNYTSGIDSEFTIARIERMLMDAGATGIAKKIENGEVTALIFQLDLGQGQKASIKLPANIAQCQKILWDDFISNRKNATQKTIADFLDQATRTAWKLQQDWVEVQLSLIRLKQIKPMQAFLAYAYDGHQTFYERCEIGGFKSLLLAAPSEVQS